MPQAGTIDQQLLMNQAEEQQAAGELRQRRKGKKKKQKGKKKKQKDDSLDMRLREVKKRAKDRNLKGMSKNSKRISKTATNQLKKKMAKHSDGVFMILLLIAIVVDLVDILDLGTATTIINICVYILAVISGFILYAMKSGNKYNIFYLLKGQLWKYIILPLLEWVPFLSALPFWTSTVLMMWLKVRFLRKKTSQAG